MKLYLSGSLPATGVGYRLYVGDERILRYTEFQGGIYFKILNPQFIHQHQDESLRFSTDGETFIETGAKLPNFDSSALVTFSLAATNAAQGTELLSKRAALKD